MTAPATPTSYDELPYPSFPLAQTHPDRLATFATLFGMSPPPVERCRVLEIGCADGGNLLSMAEALPESEFVGIDLSARQIADGQAVLAAVGLKNVTLRQLSILDVPADFGPFDYIVCHGVYSWVPPAVQDKILALCGSQLTPNGVAFISYNTYPGWHNRAVGREMLRFRARHGGDPQMRTAAARDFLSFVIEAVPEEHAAYRQLLKEEQERIGPCADSYVFHEHLEDVNDPVYFHEFMTRAAGHGLQYLGEAEPHGTFARRVPPEVAAVLDRLGSDVLRREQYLDFLRERMFRQTLLCRASVSLARPPQPERLAALEVASSARCKSPLPDLHSAQVEEFQGRGRVSISTGHAISKAALVHLAEVWPQAVPFDVLATRARARLVGDAVVVQEAAAYARDTHLLADNLLQAFTADVVKLHVHAARLVLEPGAFPRTSALARFQAGLGTRVTNLRQQVVDLDPLTIQLVRLLDGRHDRPALVEALARAVVENNLVVKRFDRAITDADYLRHVLTRELDENLRHLGRCALLVA
ncbi:MAG TPA: class I SAM-dependent methyltransferase [Gemmataceae bacterium]|nr:class I SAM-dependent methyltransferase [Gemmataceae bacterium]